MQVREKGLSFHFDIAFRNIANSRHTSAAVVQPQISDVCPWPYVVEKKEMTAVINPQVSAQNRKMSGFGVSINDR